jgi:phosphoribosylformylglycinamidine cyclo-ligase
VPPIFDVMSRLGQVDPDEMYRVFNMGIGLVLVVPSDSVHVVLAHVRSLGEQAWPIGEIISSNGDEPGVEYVD